MISLYVIEVILNRNSHSTGLDWIKMVPLCACVSNLQISPMVSTFHNVPIPFLHDESVDLKRKMHVKSCFHILTKRLGENTASQMWVSWAQWASGWWRFVRITCAFKNIQKNGMDSVSVTLLQTSDSYTGVLTTVVFPADIVKDRSEVI